MRTRIDSASMSWWNDGVVYHDGGVDRSGHCAICGSPVMWHVSADDGIEILAGGCQHTLFFDDPDQRVIKDVFGVTKRQLARLIELGYKSGINVLPLLREKTKSTVVYSCCESSGVNSTDWSQWGKTAFLVIHDEGRVRIKAVAIQPNVETELQGFEVPELAI